MTEEQHEQAAELLAAFYEAIAACGDRGLPSGVLYAILCDKLSMQGFLSIVLVLKRMSLITERGNVLYAYKAQPCYIYTLDSHDYYGPCFDEQDAREWATIRGFSSFKVVPRVPLGVSPHNLY